MSNHEKEQNGSPHSLQNLPSTWQTAHLVDLVEEMADGGTPSRQGSNEYFGGEINWAVVEDVEYEIEDTKEKLTDRGLKNSSATLWPAGSVIVTTGATIGKVGLAVQPTATKQGITGIIPGPQIHAHYLARFLESNRSLLSSWAQGTTFKEIRPYLLGKVEVAVPPFDEQRKIASVLYTVDQLVEKTEATIEQSARLRRGVVQDVFRYGLEEDGTVGRLNVGATELRETKYGEVPADWEMVALTDLVPDDSPITYGIVQPGKHHSGGVPVIRVEDIVEGQVVEEDLLHTDPKLHEKYSRAEVQAGDLLFSIRGTVGRMAFVPEKLEGSNITQDTARVRIRGACPLYVRWYLETDLAQSFVERHIVGQAVKGLNLEDLRRVPVALPARRQQERIVAIISSLTEQIEIERKTQGVLKRLKSGLMQELLSGRVRTDEKAIEVIDEVAAYG